MRVVKIALLTALVAPLVGCQGLPKRENCATTPERTAAPSNVAVPHHASGLHEDLIPSASREFDSRTISVVAYNTHLLPDIAANLAGTRGESEYRAQAIGQQLAGFDLIGFSEVFDDRYAQQLVKSLAANRRKPLHFAYGPKRSGRHLIGSGLVLVSRWPVIESHTHTYSSASRFISSGFKADGFAAKGVLHARMDVYGDGKPHVDCFLTHLESRSESSRARQIEELGEFVHLHSSPANPILLLGDFNVVADPQAASADMDPTTAYSQLMNLLSQVDRQLVDLGAGPVVGPGGTSDALSEHGDRRIDYIFVSPGSTQTGGQLTCLETQHLALRDPRVPEGSLSDHLAVASWIKLR